MKTQSILPWKAAVHVIVALLGSVVISQQVYSQDMSSVKRQSEAARLNLALPDAPAFKLLDESPSTVLRPATVQELSLATSDFTRGNSMIPKAFAAEFSPGMLIGGSSLTIDKYRSSAFFYRARVSAASKTLDDGSGTVQASIGLRLTVIDESDPRMDDTFIQKLSSLASQINDFARGVQSNRPTESGPIAVNNEQLEQQLEDLRTRQKDSLWNKSLIEVAGAVRFTSSDSLSRHAKADRYAGWLVASFPISQWGQLLFGVSGNLDRNSPGSFDSSRVSVSGRFYIGSNKLKVFTEGQMDGVKSSPPRLVLQIGGELNVWSSFWLEFSGGVEEQGSLKSSVSTSFNVRWSLPEKL